jgi:hypothetical protein
MNTRDNAKKEGCFIATACYGSYDAPEVRLLRQYRDVVLQRRRAGRMFVRLYYAISPFFARLIARRELAKGVVRALLVAPLVKIVRALLKGREADMKEVTHGRTL